MKNNCIVNYFKMFMIENVKVYIFDSSKNDFFDEME